MPDEAAAPSAPSQPLRSKDEIALEMMKFIAVSTGYGRSAAGAGFSGKPARTPEEQAETLLQLFERCRSVLK
ncbi:MAG: hypothetical protein FJW37_05595 [Acidobacteria bacterium]|nr:hypothetical protein [Acidobacteriota bacterium]